MSKADDFKAWCSADDRRDGVTFEYDDNGHVCAVTKRVSPSLRPVYEALRLLKSPSLPQILSISEQADSLLITESYISGRTLRQVIAEDGKLPDARLLPLAKELCGVLSLLHSQTPPIIHRDIKPENIILSDTGHCVLIDFDASRHYTQEADSDTVYLGTHGYAASEQYGFSQTDSRSDIFSLGVTLYELRMGEQYKKGAVCDGALSKVIAKCTEFDAVNRYQSAGELMEALEKPEPRRKKASAAIFIGGAVFVAAVVCLLVLLPSAKPADAPLPSAAPLASAEASAAPSPAATPQAAEASPTPSPTPEPTPSPTPEPTPEPLAYMTEEALAYLAIPPAKADAAVETVWAHSFEDVKAALELALNEPERSYLCILEGRAVSPENVTIPANTNLAIHPGSEFVMESGTVLINNGYIEIDGTRRSRGRLTVEEGCTVYCCGETDTEDIYFCPCIFAENGTFYLGANTTLRCDDSQARHIAVGGEFSGIECDAPETVTFVGEGFIYLDPISGCPEEFLTKPAVTVVEGN